jgi:FixJ family two-component response regulator
VPNMPMIAIVDDDQGVREALDGLLQALGYRAVAFESAEDFLESADRSAIACMIVDVRMPGLSGIELQALLNTQGVSPPIIFLTSFVDDSTRAKAFEGGAACFLGKPVDAEVLLGCLRNALA